MALATYANLKTSIANWLNRSDLTTEIAEDFIVLTEADFNSKLRVRKMISSASITIDSETESIPSDFLQVRDFFILEGGTKNSLKYITPAQMDQIRGSSTTGMPSAYTILGDNFRFAPIPSSAYTGTLNYYAKFSALSDANTSNYILTSHPAIYLYGALYHAANFLGGIDPQRLQQWQSMYTTAMERLERNDRDDQYGSAPLQQRGDVAVSGSFNDRSRVITNNNG